MGDVLQTIRIVYMHRYQKTLLRSAWRGPEHAETDLGVGLDWKSY